MVEVNMQSLRRKDPDFAQLLKVLRRRGRPSHLPNYEHAVSAGFVERWTGRRFKGASLSEPEHCQTYVDFWLSMGFECIPLEIPLKCRLPTAEHGKGGFGSESRVVIRDRAEYDAYDWPTEQSPIDFRPFEIIGSMLPNGVKIVGGVCMGPYEWASEMLGIVGMSMLLQDDPDLVREVLARLGRLIAGADRQLATMDAVGALRQGDDLGFRTSTFLSPAVLREMVFPIYRQLTDIAHAQSKPFILHSCGQLKSIYDDLIDYCKIDAKHSFEEAILPVNQFKAIYGQRVTPLGGLDVDMICRGSEEQIRSYTRQKIEQCYAKDGYWALGTGNSLTDYMPIENYRIVLEEGLAISH